MISLMLATALLLGDGSAFTLAQAPAAAEEKKPAVNKDGLICKKERVVGSRMPTKICMTPAQWEERKAMDREAVDKMQRVMQAERG